LKLHIAAVAGVSLLGAVAVALPGTAGGNKYASTTQDQTCYDSLDNEVGTVALAGPEKLWPPNHKLIDELISAAATNGTDQTTVTAYPSSVDNTTGGDGGTQHDPDWTPGNLADGPHAGAASVAFQVRAERSGKGEGRTYFIDWVAQFGNTTCDSRSDAADDYVPFEIAVPHDMRGGADWK
jgi:hypothetical protein